jgi:hypothetical protein
MPEYQNPYKSIQYGDRKGLEDEPTDMAKLIVAFRNFAESP